MSDRLPEVIDHISFMNMESMTQSSHHENAVAELDSGDHVSHPPSGSLMHSTSFLNEEAAICDVNTGDANHHLERAGSLVEAKSTEVSQDDNEDYIMLNVMTVPCVPTTKATQVPSDLAEADFGQINQLISTSDLLSCHSFHSQGSDLTSVTVLSMDLAKVSDKCSPLISRPSSVEISSTRDSNSEDLSERTDDDDDSCEENPLMIAFGLPVVSQDFSINEEEQVDGCSVVHREKGAEELNQEAVDEVLAENVAVNDQNEKSGKKVLPEVDIAALIRRQSSRLSGNKSSSGSKSAELGTNDGSSFRYSNSPPEPMTLTPVFGTRPQSDLLDEVGEDHDDDNLVAHHGITLLPGAVPVPGRSASVSDNDTYQSDYQSDEETSNDEENEDSGGAIDAVPVRPDARESRVVVNGVIIDDDEMTDEQRKAALLRWRRIQAASIAGILLVAFIITAIVIVTSNVNTGEDLNREPDGWLNMGSALSGPPDDENAFFGTAFSLSGSGIRLATGLPGLDDGATEPDAGQVQIYDFQDNEWVQNSILNFSSRSSKAGESLTLSSDGTRIIVGSPFWSEEVGYISVFEDTGGGVWQQIGENIQGKKSEEDGRFGEAVAISQDGRIIAAGGPFAHHGTSILGVVRVFADDASEWVQRGQILIPGLNDTLFGASIDLSSDGNRIAVGSTNYGVQKGRVDIFDFNGTHWNQSGEPLIGTDDFESFGSSVALNADGLLLAVGAIGSSGADGRFNSGKVQVFRFALDEWVQLGGDILGFESEALGTSVDLSDDGILAVGCPSAGEAGQVKIFSLDVTREWTLVKAIEGVTEGETFGFSVSISADGRKVGSGAPNSNFDGGRAKRVGAARVYQNTGPEYISTARDELLI